MNTTLHTVNKPASRPALQLARAALAKGDALLFIEDGVTTLTDHSFSAKELESVAADHKLYCLHSDAQARGLLEYLPGWVETIDYDGFVQLTEQHSKTLSWFS